MHEALRNQRSRGPVFAPGPWIEGGFKEGRKKSGVLSMKRAEKKTEAAGQGEREAGTTAPGVAAQEKSIELEGYSPATNPDT